MSQHDMNVANQGFPAFRADMNNAFTALASNSAGTTEPSTTFAYQFWYDETNDLLKLRNSDNDAWITLAAFDQTNDEWEIRSAVIQAVDSAGVSIKTDDGTTRIEVQDDGDVSINSGQLFVDQSTGIVGIGTANPTNGNLNIAGNNPNIRLDDTSTTNNGEITVDDTTIRIEADSANSTANSAISFQVDGDEKVLINSGGDVGIGTANPDAPLHVNSGATNQVAKFESTDANGYISFADNSTTELTYIGALGDALVAGVGFEAMRISSAGALGIGTTDPDANIASDNGEGICFRAVGQGFFSRNSGVVVYVNRKGNDGTLMSFLQAGSSEGSISVSGSTVSFNGGHLARWSRLENDSKDASIVKGTVLTNLDAMVEWSHETTYWTEKDELPEGVSIGDVKKEAYTEENEQLNKMAVSSVEGDPNVAGVFVNWDEDDDFNDMNIAMTGDMVIRIAQGTTVQRGDLLMSAGDGTAKPQGDDIVRSKTIAKVTSTHVSHTYDDGSYLVPCVLMAC